MQFRILGPLEAVGDDDRPLLLGGPKQRALLALLLMHRGEVLSTDRLIDALWGERASGTAATTVRVYVSNLRKALGSEVLTTRGGGYVLPAAAGELDVDRFHDLVADARAALAAGDAGGARELLCSALALWRGQPLADFAYEQFAQDEIVRLEEARLDAQEDRIESELMLGRHRACLAELEALVAAHPHRERLLGQLMVALYRSGRQADALEAYHKGRRALSEELGLEPGPELRALEQRILMQDPDLAAPAAAPPSRPAAPPRTGPGRALIAAGGVLLLAAAVAAGIVELAGGKATVRAAPNTVAVIDTASDSVVGAVAVGARPGAIAFDAGSLWVANQDDQTVSRVDAATLQTVRTISVPNPPTGIAAAGGAVWVATSSSTGTFVTASRIDPQFDAIVRTVRVGNVVPGTAAAIAAHGGSLWVAPFSGELTQLDPQTGSLTRQIDPNAAPTGVDFDAGAAWVTDANADTADRVDPTGLVTPIAVGHDPTGIAIGEGGVWVADTGDDAVVRIDPDTRAVTTTIPVGHAPTGVAIGAGSVWVANSGDGTVSRIDPHTGKVVATLAVGESPQAITIADGRAWVTVDARAVSPAGAPSGGTLRIDSPVDVTSMDPPLSNDSLSVQLLGATCERLLNYPDRPGIAELVPDAAQSLPTRSADGRSYTFTIRRGLRFSPPSNEPVTAQTFKYTIERALNPRMRSPYAGEFRDIVGADAYMAGKSPHIPGVTANGDTLTIRLTAPNPDLVARVAETAFCAVPTDTPIDPNGVRVIPSAGPYRVASYVPGQGIVLTRNPNYRGNRPHHFQRIEVAVDIPDRRAVAQVEAGTADYAAGGVSPAEAATLAPRYGPGSPAAAAGHQQYFVNPLQQLDFFALNTHRPLFANVRMRQAVNYAIDRTALARLGDEYVPLPEHPTDHYLPPGLPGYSNVHIYPLTPDLAKARSLAKGLTPATAVLYTCDVAPCDEQAQILRTDLAAIGLQVEVKAYPDQVLYPKAATPGEPFDLTWVGWIVDYPDPDAMLNVLLEGGTVIPTFTDPVYRRRLAETAQLSGPRRYLAYAKLDADLVRNAAPLAAFGNLSQDDFFSARIGCQAFGLTGMDLAALCIRKTTR